jgi:serine/threonine protein kinase
MLDDNDKAMLIDFGLSNVLGGIDGSCLTPSPARPGAVRFAAPELLGVEEAISQPTGETSPMPNMCSDIYSLGCVMLNVGVSRKQFPSFTDYLKGPHGTVAMASVSRSDFSWGSSCAKANSHSRPQPSV